MINNKYDFDIAMVCLYLITTKTYGHSFYFLLGWVIGYILAKIDPELYMYCVGSVVVLMFIYLYGSMGYDEYVRYIDNKNDDESVCVTTDTPNDNISLYIKTNDDNNDDCRIIE